MIELNRETLRFRFPEVHSEANCSIEFQRTLRIPDDNNSHPLPPGLGTFPLLHVDDFADRLPADWSRHGGVFMPLYQAEALWILFSGGYPMAVKVAAGKIDAISGLPFRNELTAKPQDYAVLPDQPWLDGFCVQEGLIRQFVAMPLGQGYTAEEQITGVAEHGGLQLVVYPMKAAEYERRLRPGEAGVAYADYGVAPQAVADMGLAPGGLMRQQIYEDEHGLDAWEQDVRSRCFVHLLNSATFRQVTGAAPPHEPPTADDYDRCGLPWFDYYDGDRETLAGAKPLARLDSVAARKVKEGEEPRTDDGGRPKQPRRILKLVPDRNLVREGRF